MEYTAEEVRMFWDKHIRNEDGSINEEKLYKELHDCYFVMNEVTDVYMHITNDMLSKCNYRAEVVKSVADDCYRKQYIEQAKGFIDGLIEEELLMASDKIAALEELDRHF